MGKFTDFNDCDVVYTKETDGTEWVFIYRKLNQEFDCVRSYACACLGKKDENLLLKTEGRHFNCYASVLGHENQFSEARYANEKEIEAFYSTMHNNNHDFDFKEKLTVDFKMPKAGDILVRKTDRNDYCVVILVKDDKFYITRPNANCFLKDGSPGLYINHICLRDFYIDNEYFSKKYIPTEPFQKVLCRYDDNDEWTADMFSYYKKSFEENGFGPYVCVGGNWKQCILYNDVTKHLIGTQENLKL